MISLWGVPCLKKGVPYLIRRRCTMLERKREIFAIWQIFPSSFFWFFISTSFPFRQILCALMRFTLFWCSIAFCVGGAIGFLNIIFCRSLISSGVSARNLIITATFFVIMIRATFFVIIACLLSNTFISFCSYYIIIVRSVVAWSRVSSYPVFLLILHLATIVAVFDCALSGITPESPVVESNSLSHVDISPSEHG